MKIKLYILTLILLNLLTFSSTVNAQILEKEDTKTLHILPFNYIVEGSFDTKTNNPLKKYFVNVNGAIRIDDNTIALKTKDQFYAQIKVEVDKGRLVLGGINETQGPGYHYNKRISISEGKLDFPVDINCWSVNRLSMDDKDITISIYDFNTDQLLEKKKYILKPDTFVVYYPMLCYTKFNGNACAYNFVHITKSGIDFSKPITLCVEDNWERRYKVCTHRVSNWNPFSENMNEQSDGDTLTKYQKCIIESLPKGKSTWINGTFFDKKGRKLGTSLEIRK